MIKAIGLRFNICTFTFYFYLPSCLVWLSENFHEGKSLSLWQAVCGVLPPPPFTCPKIMEFSSVLARVAAFTKSLHWACPSDSTSAGAPMALEASSRLAAVFMSLSRESSSFRASHRLLGTRQSLFHYYLQALPQFLLSGPESDDYDD